MSSSEPQKSVANQLTKYPVASLRELFTLAFPLILTTFSTSLLNSADRYLLSHFSQDAWKACSSAMNLLYLPQLGLIIIASISQAFVGHYKGANQQKMIGPFIWQMIYFSLITTMFTYPLILAGNIYLSGVEVERDALTYFQILAFGNFLYPLGATLASFYMGRGKNKVVLVTNFILQTLNVTLDFFLIFGVKGLIPPLGVKGAAIATVTSQSIYCIILFSLFKQRKYQPTFLTHKWRFDLPLFWEGLKTGIPRSFGRTLAVGAWSIATYFLIHRGGDYLLVHTFGLTIFVILSFINEGMAQALLTFNSHTLASNYHEYFKKSLRTAIYFLMIMAAVLAIPLLLLKDFMILLFIKDPISTESYLLLKECCVWVWIAIIGSGINRIGVSMVTASRDTIFYAFCNVFHWFNLCIPVFIGIEKLGWSPSKFFLIEGLNSALLGVIFIIRFFKEPCRQFKPRFIKINYFA